MKKIVFLFSIVILSSLMVSIYGQNEDLLKFKGIPIRGSSEMFCQELEKKGFEKVELDISDGPVYSGDFLNREAVVLAMSNEDDSIHSVGVVFKPYTDTEWNFLFEKYKNTIELYTAKYGEPVNTVAEKPDYAESNSSIVLALFQGLVHYLTEYETGSGYIQIMILPSDVSYKATISIVYRDKEGVEKAYRKQIDDI